MSALTWVAQRLREPSTWRGLVWIATAAGVSLSPEMWGSITAIGMALAGLIGVLSREEPTRVEIQLPSIDLIGESQAVRADGDSGRRAGDRDPDPGRLPQQPVSPVDYPVRNSNTSEAADHGDFPGWGS